MAGVRLCPTACPTSRDFPMVEPNRAGIIIRVSGIRVPPPASLERAANGPVFPIGSRPVLRLGVRRGYIGRHRRPWSASRSIRRGSRSRSSLRLSRRLCRDSRRSVWPMDKARRVIGGFDVNITRDVTDWILVGVSVMTSLATVGAVIVALFGQRWHERRKQPKITISVVRRWWDSPSTPVPRLWSSACVSPTRRVAIPPKRSKSLCR